MAKDFLHYYNIEMQYMREMCGEFARDFPKVASRFNMNEFSCEDPYVEHLLQGYAFISARAHQALDGGFPELSKILLNNLYPDFLMPIPSTGIAKLDPASSNEIPPDGLTYSRGTELKTSHDNETEECYFHTTHDVKIWPINIVDAKYYPDDISPLGLNRSSLSQSCLCIELKTNNGTKFNNFNMDSLEFYLANSPVTMEMYEMMLANCSQIIIDSKNGKIRKKISNSRRDIVTSRGFNQDDSLFPASPQIFEGYRLFRKFFVLPQSFMFIQVQKLKRAIKEMDSDNIRIMFVFDRENQKLKGKINKNSFSLFCTPVVNLFNQVFYDINFDQSTTNIDLFQDSSSRDIEILKVLDVQGAGTKKGSVQSLAKLHSDASLLDDTANSNACYSLNCSPRSLTEEELESETGTYYTGTNTFISLVDQNNKPYQGFLDQLKIITMCSNRDLPLRMSHKKKNIYLSTDSASVVMDNIKLIYGPTKPYCDHLLIPPWEIINHISLNFLALDDQDNTKTAEIIKNILELYTIDEMQKKHIDGILSIVTSRKQQRFNNQGDYSFVNGLSVDLSFDPNKAEYYFLLGMVIDRFFAHATPVDTFIQTTINTKNRGKITQCPVRKGTRPLI